MEGPSFSGACTPPFPSKIFVAGIPPDADEDALRRCFAEYGEVVDAVVARDKFTGRSRGFGFVHFFDQDAAARALAAKDHTIDGRKVDVKIARTNSERHNNRMLTYPQGSKWCSVNSGTNGDGSVPNKIFVGGLPSSLTEDEFREYFEKFGKIADAVIMHDSQTNKPRGFGFITYESESSVGQVMHSGFYDQKGRCSHPVGGKDVEVRRAIRKNGTMKFYDERLYGAFPLYSPSYYYQMPPLYSPYPFEANGFTGAYGFCNMSARYSPSGCAYYTSVGAGGPCTISDSANKYCCQNVVSHSTTAATTDGVKLDTSSIAIDEISSGVEGVQLEQNGLKVHKETSAALDDKVLTDIEGEKLDQNGVVDGNGLKVHIETAAAVTDKVLSDVDCEKLEQNGVDICLETAAVVIEDVASSEDGKSQMPSDNQQVI